MTTIQTSLGAHRLIEAVQSGENLGELLSHLADHRHTQAGAELFGGAVSALVGCFVALRRAGVRPAAEHDAELERFLRATPVAMASELNLMLATSAVDPLATRLSALCGIVAAMRERVDVATALQLAGLAQPAAPPLEIRIVAMPERESTSTVERHPGTKEITGARITERDAA